MNLINLKINISLDIDFLTEEQYAEISKFFAVTDSNIPLDNKEVIEILALDKRPFFTSVKSITPPSKELIRTAKIELIC